MTTPVEVLAAVRAEIGRAAWPARWRAMAERTEESFERPEATGPRRAHALIRRGLRAVDEFFPDASAVASTLRRCLGPMPPAPRAFRRELALAILDPSHTDEPAPTTRDLALMALAIRRGYPAGARCTTATAIELELRAMRSAIAAVRRLNPALRPVAHGARIRDAKTCPTRVDETRAESQYANDIDVECTPDRGAA